ncbi:uncharacterized protein LOC101851368 [Aplysia californica]|uniref:Uncharacterized protein LOC101851368 n=1 Tax=Aplysia californica TaxID=6500 RepID=A0ABM1A958_APLCA|nr:uncharacterized protein LOC101851368 [Aplysia californica]
MRERMRHRREITSCNGDVRLCPLRLDQVTLPGLHNAGSGFAGGFGFLNCWMRNHGLNITEQLRRGIRHLDVDPCYETCGLLGTCHAFSCGGSVCAMIKQIREFMRENRNDVITVNFNHEIVDENKVFRGLSRQLEVQVRPLLNRYYRVSPRGAWPTLQRSIRINRRLFVFYAPIIENEPHSRLYYNRKKWIHSENLLASTWRPFSLSNGCEPMIALTNRMCESRKYKALVEVSVIPESGGACTHAMADACRPHVHQMLRACEAHRFPSHKSPNIVLVDWPEEASDDVTSVYHAVRHQNVRNIATHRPISCQVRVDAAFHMTNTSRSFFFVGQRLVEYDHDVGAQIASRSLDVLNISTHGDVSSAFFHETTRKIHVFQGCRKVELDPVTLTLVSGSEITRDPCTPVDAALTWNGMQILFEGCHVHNPSSPDLSPEQLGFPCDVDAALMHDGHVYAFKGNDYYRYDTRQNQGRLVGRTLDWTIDAVQCP